jgi:hypothetical protein
VAVKTGLDPIGLALFVLSMAIALLLVPDLSGHLLGQPVFWAVVGGIVTQIIVVVARSQGRRGTILERAAFAIFLFAMPSVYCASWLRDGDGSAAIWIELGGQAVFGALAVLGFVRWPWMLALGIGAHGILWDAWHVDAKFIPRWYALACAVVDVGLAVYVAAQVPIWNERRRSH